MSPQAAAEAIRTALPLGGLFANQDWRISPSPFPLERSLVRDLESLGRVLLQFYRAVNLLYRQSAEGKQPAWVADYLDRGKPDDLIALQRSPPFKNEIPRVIRPDIYLEAMKEMGVKVDATEEKSITLFDGVFDGKDPEKYARSFAINSLAG